jgi:hypothetical protein
MYVQTFVEWLKERDDVISRDDLEEEYREMLREEYPVRVAGVVLDAAEILEENDNIMYRCGFNDFCDGWNELEDDLYCLNYSYDELLEEYNDYLTEENDEGEDAED